MTRAEARGHAVFFLVDTSAEYAYSSPSEWLCSLVRDAKVAPQARALPSLLPRRSWHCSAATSTSPVCLPPLPRPSRPRHGISSCLPAGSQSSSPHAARAARRLRACLRCPTSRLSGDSVLLLPNYFVAPLYYKSHSECGMAFSSIMGLFLNQFPGLWWWSEVAVRLALGRGGSSGAPTASHLPQTRWKPIF